MLTLFKELIYWLLKDVVSSVVPEYFCSTCLVKLRAHLTSENSDTVPRVVAQQIR